MTNTSNIDTIIHNIMKHEPYLDENILIILNFEDVVTIPLYEGYISGIIKYDPNKDPHDLLVTKNIIFLSDISLRSHVYILTRNYNKCTEYFDKLSKIHSINILDISKPKCDIICDLYRIHKPKFIYYVDKYKDRELEELSKSLNIENQIIISELVSDMQTILYNKYGKKEGAKLIELRQQEYLINIV